MNAKRLLDLYDRVAEAPDAVARLRRFVLDLAVRGKLVEQDPVDEPASELLKRITVEKVNSSFRDQTLSYKSEPAYSPEMITLIPETWEWSRITDLSLRLHYGYTASANPKLSNVRLLRITDIQDNRVDWRNVPGCKIDARSLENHLLEQGDILIARTGGTIGKTYLVSDMPVVSVFASYLIRLKPARSLCDRYIKLFCDSDIYWMQLHKGTRGGAQPNVNGTVLGRMLMPLPPLAEQRRIVAKVDEMMEFCDKLESARSVREEKRDRLTKATLIRLNEPEADAAKFRAHARFAIHVLPKLTVRPDQIKQLRQTILNLAVRGKLVAQDPEDEPASELLKRIAKEKEQLVKVGKFKKLRNSPTDEVGVLKPFEVPKNWSWCRLDRIGAIVGGGTPPSSDPTNFTAPGHGIPWLTPADLGRYKNLYVKHGSRDLSYKGLNSSSATLMPTGTVLFTCRAPIGYVAISANAISTNQGFKSIVPFLSDCSRYIALAMQAFATQIDADASGTTFKEVSGKIVAAMPLPLPPLADQQRIVNKVDQLMGLYDRLEETLAATKTNRRKLLESVLHEAFAPVVNLGNGLARLSHES